MRVIAGSAGGLSLTVPVSVTRPTTDRTREALFSSLGDRVIGARILDLYAGSGALGIEALSRGARSAVFVEENARAADTIVANLRHTRLATPDTDVRRARVETYLKAPPSPEGGRFDLIFADPPYARDEETAAELIRLLAHPALPAALRPGGLFILETMDGSPLPQTEPPRWSSLRDRRYGGTRLHFLAPVT